MKRILDSGSRRRLTVAAVVVIATLGFAVGSASASERHLPWGGHYCPLSLSNGHFIGCGPIIRPPVTVTTPETVCPLSTSPSPVKNTGCPPLLTLPHPTTTTVKTPITIKVPTPITIPSCPNPGPIRAEAGAVSSDIMCPMTESASSSSVKAGSTVATSSSATEIGTACSITRNANGTTTSSAGCAN